MSADQNSRRPLQKSLFHVAEMDCPSEEQMIRTALSAAPHIERIDVNIPGRAVSVWHRGGEETITERLESLSLGAELRATGTVEESELDQPATRDQSRVLRFVLAVNLIMFGAELVVGWLAESTGLLADSLDMLADAAVYGLALWAVGRAAEFQRRAARLSGWLQLLLAILVLAEVGRRLIFGSSPEPGMIIVTAGLALIANVACMYALAGHRNGGAHMQASWIFTTTDVIANIGVIVAAVLVILTASEIPDLIAGALIGLLVLRSALRILKVGRT